MTLLCIENFNFFAVDLNRVLKICVFALFTHQECDVIIVKQANANFENYTLKVLVNFKYDCQAV